MSGGKSPRAKEVRTRDRISGESIATLTDAAIRLGPKKTGEVWVFANDFWTGVIHLAGDVAAALDIDELEQAIALEAETFSGISAFDSRLGVKPSAKGYQWRRKMVGHADSASRLARSGSSRPTVSRKTSRHGTRRLRNDSRYLGT